MSLTESQGYVTTYEWHKTKTKPVNNWNQRGVFNREITLEFPAVGSRKYKALSRPSDTQSSQFWATLWSEGWEEFYWSPHLSCVLQTAYSLELR